MKTIFPVLQCLEENNLNGGGLARTLIWLLEIIPAPAAQYVKLSAIQASVLDEYFSPVELDKTKCNCSYLTTQCLVAMISDSSSDPLNDLCDKDSLVLSEEECPVQEDGEDDDSLDNNTDPEEVEYFSESSAVKGAMSSFVHLEKIS